MLQHLPPSALRLHQTLLSSLTWACAGQVCHHIVEAHYYIHTTSAAHLATSLSGVFFSFRGNGNPVVFGSRFQLLLEHLSQSVGQLVRRFCRVYRVSTIAVPCDCRVTTVMHLK